MGKGSGESLTFSFYISFMIPPFNSRLLSLDFLRGFIMVLLALESTRLYDHLFELSAHSFIQDFVTQFFHHPWNGLRFWDLIQPGFMFMAGTAMAFSLHKQSDLGGKLEPTIFKDFKTLRIAFLLGCT